MAENRTIVWLQCETSSCSVFGTKKDKKGMFIWINCHSSCTPFTDVVNVSVLSQTGENHTAAIRSGWAWHSCLYCPTVKILPSLWDLDKELLTAWVSLHHKRGEALYCVSETIGHCRSQLLHWQRGAEVTLKSQRCSASCWLPWGSQRTEIARTRSEKTQRVESFNGNE